MVPVSCAHLQDCPLLASLSDADREQLRARVEEVNVPAGTELIHQGARDRAMYFVLDGQASVTRGGIEVEQLSPGRHFGELALLAGQPRGATITAVTDLRLAKLSEASYVEMAAQHPRATLRLVQAIVGSVGGSLKEMTDSVGALLRERSLPRRTRLKVRTPAGERDVPTGTVADDLLDDVIDGVQVVAALVDKKAVPLSHALTSSCTLEPIVANSSEGERIVRQSLALLLLEAADRIAAEVSLHLGHSLGFGQRVDVVAKAPLDLHELADRIQAEMNRLLDQNLVVQDEWWTRGEAIEHFRERGWSDAVALLATWREPMVPLATYGRVHVLHLEPLSSTRALRGFRLVANGEKLLLLYPSSIRSNEISTHSAIIQARAVSRQAADMTGHQERWLHGLGINSVGDFNQACLGTSVAELIRVSEGFHEKRISAIADEISRCAETAQIVSVAGPSSSGKTTFLKRLRVQLQVNGAHPIEVSLDDFYVDREKTPRDAKGELDFESFDALDTALLKDQLNRLLDGQKVTLARYDFKTGKSLPDGGRTVQLGPRDVLMLEGIHGLNPRLLELVPNGKVFSIFICPLAQLPFDRLTRVHASDVRLLRRIVRDRHTRNLDAAQNIARWPSVRDGERRHIFPYQDRAQAVFDTSLIYELSVLKVYAQRYLLEVPHDHPSFATAFRLLALLDHFVTIYPDHVPPTSLLREFIGGGFE